MKKTQWGAQLQNEGNGRNGKRQRKERRTLQTQNASKCIKMPMICWSGTNAQDHWEVANLPIEEFNQVNLAKCECEWKSADNFISIISDALNRLENLHRIQIESLHLVISFTCLAHVSLKGLGISAVHTCTTLFEMKRHQTSPSDICPSKFPKSVEFAHPYFVWNWMSVSKRTHRCNRPNGARNLGLTTSATTIPKNKTNFATIKGLRTKGRISD